MILQGTKFNFNDSGADTDNFQKRKIFNLNLFNFDSNKI